VAEPTVTVTIEGQDVPGVHHLAGYSPVIGDAVLVGVVRHESTVEYVVQHKLGAYVAPSGNGIISASLGTDLTLAAGGSATLSGLTLTLTVGRWLVRLDGAMYAVTDTGTDYKWIEISWSVSAAGASYLTTGRQTTGNSNRWPLTAAQVYSVYPLATENPVGVLEEAAFTVNSGSVGLTPVIHNVYVSHSAVVQAGAMFTAIPCGSL